MAARPAKRHALDVGHRGVVVPQTYRVAQLSATPTISGDPEARSYTGDGHWFVASVLDSDYITVFT